MLPSEAAQGEAPMAGAFPALSPEELTDTLDRLQEAVERRPGLAGDPTFVGTMRLALTAAGRPPPKVVVSPSVTIAAPASADPVEIATYSHIGVDTSALEGEVELLNGEVARLEGEVEILERKLREVRVESSGCATRLADAQRLEQESRARVEDLGARLRGVEHELGQARKALVSVQTRNTQDVEERDAEIRDLRAKLSVAEATEVETEMFRKGLRDWLVDFQWCAKSPKFTDRKSGKPLPSCPVCHGLNPKGFVKKDSDMGHRPGCVLNNILTRLAE